MTVFDEQIKAVNNAAEQIAKENNFLPVYMECVFCHYPDALWVYMPLDKKAGYTCRRCGRTMFFRQIRETRRGQRSERGGKQ